MNQDPQFTTKLQAWVNTPDKEKDWDMGALLLFQLSGNRIMYHNISVNPKGKAEFIKGQLQKYLKFRLQKLTRDEVCQMQSEVDEIIKKVIKPASESNKDDSNKSEEFADFKAGKRADHDLLPEEIQARYVENLDIVHRMRELHLKLRTLSLDNATCPDSERYPFLKEIIALDKKRVENWDIYDHFIPGTSETVEEPVTEEADATEAASESEDADKETETSVYSEESTASLEQSAPAEQPVSLETEAKPKKGTAKRATKKASKKQ